MHTDHVRPCALLGLLLTALASLRGFTLGKSAEDRLLLPLGLLGLGALALLLLKKEKVSRAESEKLLLAVGLALFLRALLLSHVTLDYEDFLSKWVEHFRQNGGFRALKDPVGNYNVPYLYLLALLSRLPVSDLYGIKLFSMVFDVLLAWGGLKLTRAVTDRKGAAETVFALILLLPTVVLNGACWGQCDSVWAAFCVLALATALEDKPKTSLALLALAFSFKLQAIFLIPLWGALWLLGKVKLRDLPVFPAVFALTMVPALLAGRPVGTILSVYVDQAGSSAGWGTLNYNSPSVFSLFPYRTEFPAWAAKAAIAAAFLFMLAVLALLLLRRKAVDNAALVLAGATLSLGIPFLLPYMHERYFFLGGVLLVCCAAALPRLSAAAAGAELASLGGYHAYLMGKYAMTLSLFGAVWTQPGEGLLLLFALVSVTAALWMRTRTQ